MTIRPLKPSLVCSFDFRVETNSSSSDTGSKYRHFDNWGILLEGDTLKADRLLNLFSSEFHNKAIGPVQAVPSIMEVVAVFKRELVNEYVQTTLAMSYDDFRKDRQAIPANLDEQIFAAITRIEIGCELILFNVDYKSPYVFRMDPDGTVTQVRNFCAIGTGAPNAEAWLHYRQQIRFDTLEKTVASVYEAKKFAEHAPGVGKLSRILIVDAKNKVWSSHSANSFEYVWSKNGPRKQRTIADIVSPDKFVIHAWEDAP